MNPASRSDIPARPAFGRAVAFWRGPAVAAAALAAALAAASAWLAGCGHYVPGTIVPATPATAGAAWSGDAAVSPDGKHVAFVSERADGRRGLYLLPAWAAQQADPAHVAAESLVTGPYAISRPAWAHDGHSVLFTRVDPATGETRTCVVSAVPGTPRTPAVLAVGPPNGAAMDAVPAPDGSGAIALVARGDSTAALGTWSAGGGFRPLVDVGTGELPARPTWHGRKADGLAYARGGALWWIARTGGAPVRLTTGPSRESEPAFSPDGRWLAFVSDTTGVPNVWLARFAHDARRGTASLGAWRPVTASFQPVGHPAWAPDGRALWFERQDPWYVVAREANLPGQGSAGAPPGPPDTLSSSLFDCRAPSFSGDGTHIAFASTRGGPWHVFAMAAAGEAGSGPAKQLTQGPSPESEPRWSRASGQIAFVRGADTLALTDPAGAVLGDVGEGRAPAWSPDGRALAYADRAGTLWALEGVGRARRALTAPGVRALDPCWGTGALAGTLVYAGAATGGHVPLWRVPEAGGAAAALTTDDVAGADDAEPAISPDGHWVCFTRQRRGDRDLWLLDVTAGDARPLVVNPRGQDGHAEWSPDGRRIVYESGGAVHLYRADVRPLLQR